MCTICFVRAECWSDCRVAESFDVSQFPEYYDGTSGDHTKRPEQSSGMVHVGYTDLQLRHKIIFLGFQF